MKTIFKTSYIILSGSLLLSSCAQEDTPSVGTDNSDRRIVFHTSLPELTTKATEIATDLPHFFVTAFDETDSDLIVGDTIKGYFYNMMFEKEPDTNKVVSDSCVWPDPGKESDKLHFFAYYPELKLGATTVNGTSASESDKTIGYKIDGFQVAPDISDQVDFVTAYATGSMEDNLFSGVHLNFEHQLSRIEVKAYGANKSCDIEIAGIRIGGVNVNGDFDFKPSDGSSAWSAQKKGTVEHIFQNEEKVIILSKNGNSHATLETAASIMGANIGDENNCAMLIPTTDEIGWKFGTDIHNLNKGMYISVLLRVIDKTPGGSDKQQYPYFDNSQGLNAMNIPKVYLAVHKSGKVIENPGKLYIREDNHNDYKYYIDEAKTIGYQPPFECIVKEFGWAAFPVTCKWEPGYTYTYTLDYTSGVGLHGPDVTGVDSPKAGDPIISDIVGVTVSVNGWQGLNSSTTHTVAVPGS